VIAMTRGEVLRDLRDNGRRYDTPRLEELATEFGLPVADMLVVAGHPVSGYLLPPDRDADIMRAFTYRVTYCNHPQLAALREFLLASPDEGTPPQSRPARDPADPDPFPAILDGLMRNRGFGVREFPFVGLSIPTVRGRLRGGWHRLSQLQAVAGRWAGVWRTWPPSRVSRCDPSTTVRCSATTSARPPHPHGLRADRWPGAGCPWCLR
jgi:hypothetical protein